MATKFHVVAPDIRFSQYGSCCASTFQCL